MKPLHFVARTSGRKEDTALFRSVTKLGAGGVEFLENNNDGLASCYNKVLDARAGRNEIVVFTHDDVFLTDHFVADKLNDAMSRYGYTVAGVAGTSAIEIASDNGPTRWPQPQANANSGAYESIAEDESSTWQVFGPTPRRCVALDGMLLAVDMRRLNGLRFDEQFADHFHDLDFCLSADRAGLLAGTTNVHLTRKQPVDGGGRAFEEAQSAFRRKWSHPSIRWRAVAPDVIELDNPVINRAYHAGPLHEWMMALCHVPDVLMPSAWSGHIPFLSLVIQLLRPRTFVELGVFLGSSFFAGCSAAQRFDTQTLCFGVDTWEGDTHAGFYKGDMLFGEMQSFAAQRYPTATLIRSSFDQSRQRFADRSIDLLHIDGLHTYEAVSEDFKTWLPKLSDRAVVLFHDTQVRERGFGVWKFWQEIRSRYPSYEFSHCYGLGVLFVGADVPAPVRKLIQYTSERQENAEILQRICSVLGDSIGARIARRDKCLPESEALAAWGFSDRLTKNYSDTST